MPLQVKKTIHSAALYSLVATCFFIPVATSMLSLFSGLTLVLWLLTGKVKELPQIVKNNLVVFLAALLFVLFLLGLVYSAAEFSESLSYLKKYRELLFFPVVVSLLQDQPVARKRCEIAFFTGCGVLMLISYGMYFSLLPMAKYGYSLLYHITHNFFMSIFAFYALHKAVDSDEKKWRLFWAVVFLVGIVNMFYVATGRTGLLVFFFLMILYFLQRFSIVKQLVSVAVLVVLLSLVFKTSDTFRTRSMAAVGEIQAYEYGASRTSLGMRFDWWVDCLLLIKEKPVLGYGTGGFTPAHDALIEGTKIQSTDNPHNEFLLVSTQLGLIGGAVFILLFFAQFLCSLKMKKPELFFVQGVIAAMVIGCLTNSFLFDSHQGHFWAILSSVYLSSLPRCIVFGEQEKMPG